MSAKRGLSPFLAILFMLGPGAASDAEQPITTTVEKDTITVRAEGPNPTEKFALVFSRQAAGITEWYDLDRDAKMTVNLAAHGNTTGFALFQNRAEMLLPDGKTVALFPEPARAFALIESNSVRAAVEIGGRMTTPSGEFPGEKLRKEIHAFTGHERRGPERPRYTTRFVVYPTGRVYIRHVVKFKGLPLALASNRMILATAPDKDVHALNEHRRELDAFIDPTDFILHHGTGQGFTGSALLVAGYRKYRTDWLGQLMTMDHNRRGWVRSAFSLHAEPRLIQPGEVVWNFMLQIEPSNVDSRESAALYAHDYLRPAKVTFIGGRGEPLLKELDDAQLDGFAEGRGCYVSNARAKPVVLMRFDGGTVNRFNPAFEIHEWKGERPKVIHVDADERRLGVHYNAHVDAEVLLIQYLGVLPRGVHTVRVGTSPEHGGFNR